MKAYRIHLVFALMASLAANAQTPKPPLDRRPPPQPLLRALDGDRDGELSPEEIAGSPAALGKLDKNGDGALSRKELNPPPPKKKKKGGMRPPSPKGASPLMKALDTDKDGALSADEIEAAPESLATLDADEDDTLSRKELKPGKPLKQTKKSQ